VRDGEGGNRRSGECTILDDRANRVGDSDHPHTYRDTATLRDEIPSPEMSIASLLKSSRWLRRQTQDPPKLQCQVIATVVGGHPDALRWQAKSQSFSTSQAGVRGLISAA
jgi:hypothetical protein